MAARRYSSKYIDIETRGALFDKAMRARFYNAVAESIEDTGEEAVGIMMGVISQNGLVKTGNLLRSTDSAVVRSGPMVMGYAKVQPEDTWSGTISLGHSGAMTKYKNRKTGKRRKRMTVQSVSSSNHRPTLTWIDKGVRKEKKLRKSANIFSRTTNALKSRGRVYDNFAAKIAAALDGD